VPRHVHSGRLRQISVGPDKSRSRHLTQDSPEISAPATRGLHYGLATAHVKALAGRSSGQRMGNLPDIGVGSWRWPQLVLRNQPKQTLFVDPSRCDGLSAHLRPT
jgi:hypothetical protein